MFDLVAGWNCRTTLTMSPTRNINQHGLAPNLVNWMRKGKQSRMLMNDIILTICIHKLFMSNSVFAYHSFKIFLSLELMCKNIFLLSVLLIVMTRFNEDWIHILKKVIKCSVSKQKAYLHCIMEAKYTYKFFFIRG